VPPVARRARPGEHRAMPKPKTDPAVWATAIVRALANSGAMALMIPPPTLYPPRRNEERR
jgi:hypothetical protein